MHKIVFIFLGLRLIIGPFSFSFLMPRSGKSENKENWDYTVDMI